jgi:2-polyprenyl-6-hydroxyphenyl methylase/3-demethylubiquinone-9 3-methyltransferase
MGKASKVRKRNDLEFYSSTAEQWWDEQAKIYALKHLNSPRFQYFDRHLQSWKNLQVLDVGCGGGFTCEFLAKRGAIVSGIDQSQPCIQIAQQHALQNQLSINYQHGVAETLPYPNDTFDVVVCVDVLEHVADLEQTLLEIYRVLKPEGIFCFDTINQTLKSKLIMIWLLEDILKEIPHGIHDWQKFIPPAHLTNLMQKMGFHRTEIKGFNLFGSTILENIFAYFYYKRTGNFRVSIDSDDSVMYIGKAVKPANSSTLEPFTKANPTPL